MKKRKNKYTAYRSKNKIKHKYGTTIEYHFFYRHDKMKWWEKILYVFFNNHEPLDIWFERIIFIYEE